MKPLTHALNKPSPSHTATGRVIDPQGLTVAQLSGERCAARNCRRQLGDSKMLLGTTPDGTPLFSCEDHDLHDILSVSA